MPFRVYTAGKMHVVQYRTPLTLKWYDITIPTNNKEEAEKDLKEYKKEHPELK